MMDPRQLQWDDTPPQQAKPVPPCCAEWEPGSSWFDGQVVSNALRHGRREGDTIHYPGPDGVGPWRFCPWCGAARPPKETT